MESHNPDLNLLKSRTCLIQTEKRDIASCMPVPDVWIYNKVLFVEQYV